MDAPPQSLVDRLAALELASPRDWRRAEAICRRLARDLPLFEEVWIDALLQLRRITAFQANELREGRGAELGVGDYVLLDRLSESRSNGATYLARPLSGGAAVALKVIPLLTMQLQTVVPQLKTLCEAGRQVQSEAAIVPHAMIVDGGTATLVSRFAVGRDARSLLVRRGALPPRVVVEIATQLCSILSEAHRNGIVHGDIRLDNLRITDRNRASLVDFGVRCCVSPVISIHEDRPVEWFQGTAPERIGTSAPATKETDVYALGCLLWHLLAGRAAFPHGDRLAVLAAHRTKRLPCIRDFAADVPPGLADAIRDMTALDPNERPADLAELPKHFTRTSAQARPRSSDPRQKSASWATAAVMLVAMCGAVATFADPQTVKQLLAVQDERPQQTALTTNDATNVADASVAPPASTLSVLPVPDAKGVVALTHPGPFAAAEITRRGSLTLRGPAGRLATIVVDDEPLHLFADEVVLENVQLVSRSRAGLSALAALALVESQNLSIRCCRIETNGNASADARGISAGLAWRQIDAADATGGRIEIADCVFANLSSALSCSSAPRRVRIANALDVRSHALLSFRARGRLPVEIELSQLTLRQVSAVIAARSEREAPDLAVLASDSILDLKQRVLCECSPDGRSSFRWRGSGVVATTDVAVTSAPPSGSLRSHATAEGIVIGRVAFAGPSNGSNADSAARVSGVPQRAGQKPGADLAKLPARPRFRLAD